jgi:hypothetical protein
VPNTCDLDIARLEDPGLVDGVEVTVRLPEDIRPRRIKSRRLIPSCLLSEVFNRGLLISSSSPKGYGGGFDDKLIAEVS